MDSDELDYIKANGFVPMKKVKDTFNYGNDKKIIETYKKLGLLEDVYSLPEKQQEKLFGIVYRNTYDNLQRDFMETGIRTIKQFLDSDGSHCAYASIRGSTSRAAVTPDEDVDIFIISEHPNKMSEYIKEIAIAEGRKLKEKHPETKRKSDILVAPIVLGDEWLDYFIDDPLYIDSDPAFLEAFSKSKQEKVAKMHSVLYNFFRNEHIFDNTLNDPFEFAKRVVFPGKRIFGLTEKERTHNMISLLTRLYGVQVKGDVTQFKITELRDAYIFELFRDLFI